MDGGRSCSHVGSPYAESGGQRKLTKLPKNEFKAAEQHTGFSFNASNAFLFSLFSLASINACAGGETGKRRKLLPAAVRFTQPDLFNQSFKNVLS